MSPVRYHADTCGEKDHGHDGNNRRSSRLRERVKKITKVKPIATMLQLNKNIDMLRAVTVFIFNNVIILYIVAVGYQ